MNTHHTAKATSTGARRLCHVASSDGRLRDTIDVEPRAA